MNLHLILVNCPTLDLHALFAYLFSALITPIVIFVIVHLIRFVGAVGTFVVTLFILLIIKRPETLHCYVTFVALVSEVQAERLFEISLLSLLNFKLSHQSCEAIVGQHNLEVAGFAKVLSKWADMGLSILSQQPCLALIRALHGLVLAFLDMASILLIRNDIFALFILALKLHLSHKFHDIGIRGLE
jgi:hypothetical protein